MVAFTFDDGPNPETTPRVIDALQKYDVPATFFIVTSRISGKLGAKGREVLARELADGFTVGDHSSTHPNLNLQEDNPLLKRNLAAEEIILVHRPIIGEYRRARKGLDQFSGAPS